MADPTIISWQFIDDYGKKKTFIEYCNSDATEAQLQGFITAHGPKLNNVTGAQPLKVTVTKPYTMPVVKPAPLDDHPVNHGGLLKFTATGTAYTFGLWVPGYFQDEVDQGAIVDEDDTATFIASVLGGETQITLQDAAGRNLAAFLSGEQRDRK